MTSASCGTKGKRLGFRGKPLPYPPKDRNRNKSLRKRRNMSYGSDKAATDLEEGPFYEEALSEDDLGDALGLMALLRAAAQDQALTLGGLVEHLDANPAMGSRKGRFSRSHAPGSSASLVQAPRPSRIKPEEHIRRSLPLPDRRQMRNMQRVSRTWPALCWP